MKVSSAVASERGLKVEVGFMGDEIGHIHGPVWGYKIMTRTRKTLDEGFGNATFVGQAVERMLSEQERQ